MEQVGFVRRTSDNNIEVEVRRVSGCGESCSSCGAGCSPSHVVTLPNTVGAKVGDFVEIRGETKNLLKYTLIVYMIPFSMLLLGILGGMKILKNMEVTSYEPLSFIIGLIFLAIGYLFVKLIDRNIGKRENDTIKIIRIL